MNPALDSPWMVVSEVEVYGRVSARQVHEALNDGSLRGFQNAQRGKWRIHRDDVDAWLRGEAPPLRQPVVGRRAS